MQEMTEDKQFNVINDKSSHSTEIFEDVKISQEIDETDLPTIPGKHYFTIGEMGRLCQIKPHVLRYWEHEFLQLKNVKRRGNRRYYTRKQVLIVRQIRNLLYEQGYTIGGAKIRLSEDSKCNDSSQSKQLIRQLQIELEDVLSVLKKT